MPAAETRERPAHITAACAEGDHRTCIGTVYIWPPPEPGPDAVYLAVCGCTYCDHHVSGPYQ